VERDVPGTDPDTDFKATSFWDVKGVVTISPPPPATSGVFVMTDLTDSVLMVARGVLSLPPTGRSYVPEAGTRSPGGAGGTCSVLPLAYEDATNAAHSGTLNFPATHAVQSTHGVPGLGVIGAVILSFLTLMAAAYVVYRMRRQAI